MMTETSYVAQALTVMVSGAKFTVMGDPSDEMAYRSQVRWLSDEVMPAWPDVAAKVAQLAAGERIALVRQEAQRRMMVLLGARDAAHLQILISNGSREALRLLRKQPAQWTAEESVRAAALEQVDQLIEAIRTASNGLEAAPPEDFTDDRYWPAW